MTALDPETLGSATDRPFAVDDRVLFGHPRGLALLFVVEMWERFSFYGMRALLVLYLVNVVRWSDARADHLYGTYTGLVYLTPLLGGYLADRLIGTRRSLVIGGCIIAAGHFALALETMVSFYAGLALVIIGTGFFKPNVSTMVGQLYRPGDRRRDAGFTIFYMGINVGGFLAPLVCGYLAQGDGFRRFLVSAGLDPARSWRWGFSAAGVGMLIGLAVYLRLRDRYLPGIGLPYRPAAPSVTRNAPRVEPPLTPAERRRVLALLVTFLFTVIFWMAYEQAGSSLNLFADRYTDLHVGRMAIPSSWLQSEQPFFVLLLAPAFAALWQALGARGREPSTPLKMAIGLACIGVGYLFMVAAGRLIDSCLAGHGAGACAIAGPGWLSSFYLFSVLGELCLSPVGLSYVTKLAPARYASVLMGAWFLALAAGEKLAGELAALTSRVHSQAAFFAIPVAASLTAALALALLVPTLARLTGIEDA